MYGFQCMAWYIFMHRDTPATCQASQMTHEWSNTKSSIKHQPLQALHIQAYVCMQFPLIYVHACRVLAVEVVAVCPHMCFYLILTVIFCLLGHRQGCCFFWKETTLQAETYASIVLFCAILQQVIGPGIGLAARVYIVGSKQANSTKLSLKIAS